MRIIQVCEALIYGDGVGNDILSKSEMFSELGYRNKIYCNHIDPKLTGKAQLLSELKLNVNDIVLHHYTGFTELVDFVRGQDCLKVLIYHNITPLELVAKDMREGCGRSVNQVKSLTGAYDYYVGDSEYNIECLRGMNVISSGKVIPIKVEFDSKNIKSHKNKSSENISFLFVGRLVGNKRQEDIISIFDYYKQNINEKSELYLVGDHSSSEEYTQKIKQIIKNSPSKKNIHLLGKVSDVELTKLYNEANVYLSMSRHEGFGIPLLEAMNFNIPVFALDSTAVKETLGESGILLSSNKLEYVAKKIDEVISNEDILSIVLESQQERLKYFGKESVKKIIKENVDIWSKCVLDGVIEEVIYEKLIRNDSGKRTVEMKLSKRNNMDQEICTMEQNKINNAYRYIRSDRKYVGRMIIFLKKVTRKLLKWYIEPICFQQTEFNIATTNAINVLR